MVFLFHSHFSLFLKIVYCYHDFLVFTSPASPTFPSSHCRSLQLLAPPTLNLPTAKDRLLDQLFQTFSNPITTDPSYVFFLPRNYFHLFSPPISYFFITFFILLSTSPTANTAHYQLLSLLTPPTSSPFSFEFLLQSTFISLPPIPLMFPSTLHYQNSYFLSPASLSTVNSSRC